VGTPAAVSPEPISSPIKETVSEEPAKAKKRGRPSNIHVVPVKKSKLSFRHSRGFGHVLTLGQGDTGQLGLGEDVMEKSRPGLVADVKDAVDVVAGGMHTVVLDKNGDVWTFGCNDEGSLGRTVAEEEECFLPGKVELPKKIVGLSSGDSHTAALSEDGEVFAWGTFRDSSGPIGLTEWKEIKFLPVPLLTGIRVVKIASGTDHLAMLTDEGELYTMGNGEQGQLGRVCEKFAHRGGRRGIAKLLQPDRVLLKPKTLKFTNVWAGSYNTVVLTSKGQTMVMGLNNYSQMGLDHKTSSLTFFMPVVSPDLSGRNLDCVSMGQHHTLALEKSGAAFALGRSEYGRLGLGENCEDATVSSPIPDMTACCEVACGSAVSYAVTNDGGCFSWGMGTNGQLGTGEEEDLWVPTRMKSKQLENRKVIAVSSGGQHTVIIAKDK